MTEVLWLLVLAELVEAVVILAMTFKMASRGRPGRQASREMNAKTEAALRANNECPDAGGLQRDAQTDRRAWRAWTASLTTRDDE